MSTHDTQTPPFAVVAHAPRSDDPALITRLAEALDEVGYRGQPVAELLGGAAVEALSREQPVPALRALRRVAASADPLSAPARLAVVVELFRLARPVGQRALERALPGVGVGELTRLGLVEVREGTVRSLVDLDIHETDELRLRVVSDLTGWQRPGAALRPDHVLGVGGASRTLMQITDPRPVDRALDVGTGCGVQCFHLLRRAAHVTATDLSRRALAFARFNLVLNAAELELDPLEPEARVELREGSLLEPVAGRRFDLVVSNPPFVITPRTPDEDEGRRYTYRDGGRRGDALVAELLGAVADALRPGGSAHLLANWEIPAEDETAPERTWSRRVEQWIPPQLDAWVIQREIEAPELYAETWLRDSSEHVRREHYEEAYAAYLEDFAVREVAAVGFGWVRLDRPQEAAGRAPRRRFEHLGHPARQPVGAVLAQSVHRAEQLERLGDDWVETHLVPVEHVTEERHQRPGAEDPSIILLRQGAGLQRTRVLTSAAAGLVGACDGELSVGQITAALGALLDWQAPTGGGRAPEASALLEEVRDLLLDGFLEMAGGSPIRDD